MNIGRSWDRNGREGEDCTGRKRRGLEE